MDIDKKKNWEIAHEVTYRQLSLFDDGQVLQWKQGTGLEGNTLQSTG